MRDREGGGRGVDAIQADNLERARGHGDFNFEMREETSEEVKLS